MSPRRRPWRSERGRERERRGEEKRRRNNKTEQVFIKEESGSEDKGKNEGLK